MKIDLEKYGFRLTQMAAIRDFKQAIGAPTGRGNTVDWDAFLSVAFDFGPDVPSDDDDCIRLNLNSWKMKGCFINSLNPSALADYQKITGRKVGPKVITSVKSSNTELQKKKRPVENVVTQKVNLTPQSESTIVTDAVNHPAHYTSGKVECIDCIESATSSLTGFEGFCTGNAIKYLYRWKQKGGRQDLEKSRWYINRMLGEKPC